MQRAEKVNVMRQWHLLLRDLVGKTGAFGENRVLLHLGSVASAKYNPRVRRGGGPTPRRGTGRVELTLSSSWKERVYDQGIALVGPGRPRFVLDAEPVPGVEGVDGCWRCDAVLRPPCTKHMDRTTIYVVRYAGETFLSGSAPALAREEALRWAERVLTGEDPLPF